MRKDWPTLSLEMDEKANLISYKIAKTVIHSNFRFTYQTAQDVINNKKES